METNEILCVCVDCLDCVQENSTVQVEPKVFVCLVCYDKRCSEGVTGSLVDIYA
jgi:hypothetical protein